MSATLLIGNWMGEFSGESIILLLLVLIVVVWLAARTYTMDRWRLWIPHQVEREEARFQRRYGRPRPRAPGFRDHVRAWWQQSP